MTVSIDASGNFRSANITISNGTSLASAFDCGTFRLFGIIMPASWTTANLTFQGSVDGGTNFFNIYDASGNELTATAAASRHIYLDPAIFASIPVIKVRSGTSGTPVNQAGDRVVTLVLRAV